MLLGRTAGEHGRERRPLHQQQIGGVVADPAQLLDGEAAGEHASHAAIALREGQREKAELAESREHVVRIGRLPVDLGRPRRHLVASEGAHRIAKQPLFLAEPEILCDHDPIARFSASASLAALQSKVMPRALGWGT